jgi:DNA-binding LacI/PurR family transcriptional regulator
VDGLILKGPNHGGLPSDQTNELVRQIKRFPHVWIMGKPLDVDGDESNFDMMEAGRIAAKCFQEHGHRRVAFLNGRPGHVQFEKLKDAFQAVTGRAGIEVLLVEAAAPGEFSWPLPATSYEKDIAELAARWRGMPSSRRPTAIFVPADHTAIQLYAAFSRMGVHVGRDVSLLSCNREKLMTSNLHPSLASIEVHPEVFGSRAVDQLLWRMANPYDRHHYDIIVKPELVMGESMKKVSK